jgi:hypothetical protein
MLPMTRLFHIGLTGTAWFAPTARRKAGTAPRNRPLTRASPEVARSRWIVQILASRQSNAVGAFQPNAGQTLERNPGSRAIYTGTLKSQQNGVLAALDRLLGAY